MSMTTPLDDQHCLPQNVSPEQREAREFQLSLARTSYNYMRSYLEGVPMSADLPSGEKFNIAFEAQVLQVFGPLMKNFQKVVVGLLARELQSDMPKEAFEQVRTTFDALTGDFSLLHPKRDAQELEAFLAALAALPAALKQLVNLPKDLEQMALGMKEIFEEFVATGPTAFLKSSLFDMLTHDPGRNYLQARSQQDYDDLFDTLPLPMMMTIKPQPWMPQDGQKPCEQDWFFGMLQTAGFNTTQLRGVVASAVPGSQTSVLGELQRKLPITDAILQSVSGDSDITLDKAVKGNRLYVVDFAQFSDATADKLHGEQRYICAPIAVFYWNPNPPTGYPPGDGVLQPVCIQLAQKHDPESAPIFTPNDCADANDGNHLKWKVAKYLINVISAIQHEAVAHLGDCHLIVEPMVVASHRQLSQQHPLLNLLLPHFRFTININDDAIHSLIVPGGVVATNVGPAIESTRALLSNAHRAWRWDEYNPDNVFKLRGVDKLPTFAFRDDTRLLWKATHTFVDGYLRHYYADDQAVLNDSELQGWVNELVSPLYAGFKGLNGLKEKADGKGVQLDSLSYLIDMVAQIIYTAGPQHASVNYAQYPLMSYMPSVAGTIYHDMPTRSTKLSKPEDCMAWYPPLDVALYTFSFEYLLSGVQYDTFGHYDGGPRTAYFSDPTIQTLAADFRDELALIEIEIRKRNQTRPLPYPFQLPSQIPNSISI